MSAIRTRLLEQMKDCKMLRDSDRAEFQLHPENDTNTVSMVLYNAFYASLEVVLGEDDPSKESKTP